MVLLIALALCHHPMQQTRHLLAMIQLLIALAF
jgi:hypothetical protein